MPTYTYKCSTCGKFDIHHGINDVLNSCPTCDSIEFRKLYTSVGVQFKGKGFYQTDSRSNNGKSGNN
jgi:putative FmdB family regulatory protein